MMPSLMQRIRMEIGRETLAAELLDTPTASAIYQALPIHATALTWGEEVYFKVPVNAGLEEGAKDVIQAGELAFWVEGQCIAIGFGRTPISQGEEIRLAARANIWGRTTDDVKRLQSVRDGDPIHLYALVTAAPTGNKPSAENETAGR